MFDYKVKKSEDCILVDVENWKQVSDIEIRKIKGNKSITYITEVLDIHIHSESFKNLKVSKGDYVLLSKVASEIMSFRSFNLEGSSKYFNVPFLQIMGVFKDQKISYDSLEMIYDKILIEKVSRDDNFLKLSTNETIGKVLKIGTNSFDKSLKATPLKVKAGDVVLIKDNVSTPIRLNNKDYIAVEEKAIVGIIHSDKIEFINESILLQPYISEKVLNSNLLINPNINFEDLDYSDVYNRDLFKVVHLDERVKDLKVGDVILVKRDYTNYVYINQEKFFLLNGKEWIECRVIY